MELICKRKVVRMRSLILILKMNGQIAKIWDDEKSTTTMTARRPKTFSFSYGLLLAPKEVFCICFV